MSLANLNTFVGVTEEGTCTQAQKVSFQTSNFTAQTSKAIVENMKALAAIADDPEDPRIEWGKPFYLPCVLTKANEASASAGKVGAIMQADGSRVGPAEDADEDASL